MQRGTLLTLPIAMSMLGLLGSAEAGPAISISPSSCQIDDSDTLSEVSLSNSVASLKGSSLLVTLRCNIQNPGLDLPEYTSLLITYKDSSTTSGNSVSAQLYGVSLSDGAFTSALWNVSSDTIGCIDGDLLAHYCTDADKAKTLNFETHSYWVTITLRRSSMSNTESIYALQLFDSP